MSSGLTLLELTKKAIDLLTSVINESADNKLRGPACTELAILCKNATYNLRKEEHENMFKQTPYDLCKEALQYDNSTWVMTNCGKILYSKEAIPILQKCHRERKHTTTHHQLGICYTREAIYESKQKQKQKSRQQNDCRQKTTQSTDTLQIKLPNENFNKAEREFLEAIKLSHNKNLPAIYSLGWLYLDAGEKAKALEKFNLITNYGGKEHLMTIIKAYEQAGLVYLERKDCETLAEDKLAKAISLAVNIALSCPQLPAFAREMWQSLRTMKDIETNQSTPIDSKLTMMYKLVKNYRSSVKVVEKLLSLKDKLSDPEVIKRELNEYMKEPEKALTFLNIIRTLPDGSSSNLWKTESMKELRLKVLLRAAENRLKVQSQEATFVFQELFKLKYGECAGVVSEDTVLDFIIQDVLLIYDEDHETEMGLSQTSKTVKNLHAIFSELFGLNTSKNLQGCLQYSPKLSDEMKKYQVVIVVLGKERRSRKFEALLKLTGDPLPKTVILIDTSCESKHVPDVLGPDGCYKLQDDLSSLVPRSEGGAACGGSDQDEHRNFEGESLVVLMQLFCFIIQKSWSDYSG